MRTKSGKPEWSPDGKEDGTTGKGSDSVGKDRKRVPAGGSPYITPPLGTGVLDSSLRRRTVRVVLSMELLDRILRVQVVPGNPLVVRVVVSVPLDEVLDPTIPGPGSRESVRPRSSFHHL